MNLKDKKRRITQVVCAVLYNSNFMGFMKGNIYKGDLKGMCVPGLNCYSCPGAIGACPLGSLQSALLNSKFKTPYYILGLLIIFGALLGRVVCGFLCPFGLLQELMDKLPTPKLKKNKITRALSYLKYIILIVMVIAIPLIKNYPAFCKFICPQGTLEGGIPLAILNPRVRGMLGKLFTWKVYVLVVILIACAFIYRAFCRFICPLGALYGLFNRISVFGVEVDEKKCIVCDKCVRHCKMDIKEVGDAECIACGECSGVCPVDAICYKKILSTVKETKKHER